MKTQDIIAKTIYDLDFKPTFGYWNGTSVLFSRTDYMGQVAGNLGECKRKLAKWTSPTFAKKSLNMESIGTSKIQKLVTRLKIR